MSKIGSVSYYTKIADPALVQTLIESSIVSSYPTPVFEVIKDAKTLKDSRLIQAVLPLFTTLCELWERASTAFSRRFGRLSKLFSSVLSMLTYVCCGISGSLVWVFSKLKPTTKIKILEWYVVQGSFLEQNQTILCRYKFFSYIPFSFNDEHSFVSPLNGVFVASNILAGCVVRKQTLFFYIPLETYTLLETAKQSSLIGLSKSLIQQLDCKRTLEEFSQQEAESLVSLQSKLIEKVGSEAIERSFTGAIQKFLDQIREIENNQQLSQSDKELFISNIRLLIHSFFQSQLKE